MKRKKGKSDDEKRERNKRRNERNRTRKRIEIKNKVTYEKKLNPKKVKSSRRKNISLGLQNQNIVITD